MFYNKARHFIWNVFLALSVDSIQNYMKKTKNLNLKKCSTTGTTEESIANAEKIGCPDLLAINPLDDKIKVPVYFANFVLMDYGFGAVLVVLGLKRL